MHYTCSTCHRPIGWIKGYFICPHTRNASHTIPREPTARKTPKPSKVLEGLDLSKRARKRREDA